MNSTVWAPSDPFDLRSRDSDNPMSSNQLGCQWGGAYSLDNDLVMKEHESFPVSTGVFGDNDFSFTCLDGTMADLDTAKYALGERSNDGMQFREVSYTRTNSSPMGSSSPSSKSSTLPENVAVDTSQSSESLSPKTKPNTIKKRGRPRKGHPPANAAVVSTSDAGITSRRRISARSNPEASGADDPKALRVREKNRIAADKCRLQRRQEEDKLKSRHEDAEQEHRRLSGAVSELVAETYLLKNMLTAHGNCDCQLIQDYLKDEFLMFKLHFWRLREFKWSRDCSGCNGENPCQRWKDAGLECAFDHTRRKSKDDLRAEIERLRRIGERNEALLDALSSMDNAATYNTVAQRLIDSNDTRESIYNDLPDRLKAVGPPEPYPATVIAPSPLGNSQATLVNSLLALSTRTTDEPQHTYQQKHQQEQQNCLVKIDADGEFTPSDCCDGQALFDEAEALVSGKEHLGALPDIQTLGMLAIYQVSCGREDEARELAEAYKTEITNVCLQEPPGADEQDSQYLQSLQSSPLDVRAPRSLNRQMTDRNPQGQDPKVAKVEDALHAAAKKTLDLGSLKLSEGFPSRPGYGTKGAKVELTANYVELLPPSNMVLHRYDIQIAPEAAGRKRFRLVQLLLYSADLALHEGNVATDFRSTVFSRTKFPRDETVIELCYRSEREDVPAAGATTYKIRVTYTKTLRIGELVNYLNSTNFDQSFEDKQELTQALNIFLNHYAKSANNLATVGSTKSFPLSQDASKRDLGSGLEVIRGFFSSVRLATCRVLVNINVSHGAFYHAGPLPVLMNSYGVRNTVALEQFLKLHGAGAKDVEFWFACEASSFGARKAEAKGGTKDKGKGKGRHQPENTTASGKYISVFDFFRTTYNRVLQQPQLPLVNCGNRENPMYLPAEVCIVLAGQPSKSKLGGAQTQQMIRHAVRKPWENAASIVGDGIQTAGLDESSNVLLRSFGLRITPGLIKVPGRILGEPKVIYRGNRAANPRFGSWNMNNIKFNAGASLAKWSYLMISLPGARDAFSLQSLETVMKEFHQVLGRMGVNAALPSTGQHLSLQHPDDPAIGSMLQRAASDLDLLFIILPEANIPLYKRIKTVADKEYGIHTICSVGSKLVKDRGRDQYMANVALKFNLKLGGINQIVQDRTVSIIEQSKTMVVGIDVTHPSPGSSSHAPSVSAMVASIDKHLGQWPATLRIQRARQESVDDLTEMLKSRLTLWKAKGKHTALPENILIYRDGVSEGQYDMVLSQELPQLRRACRQMYPTADTQKGLPRFSIIICGKRHKTRFYPTAEEHCDRSGNTKPGTVVDRGVTEARGWDFFLQAHAALQGTARPCHYYIVHDEIFRQIYAKAILPPYQNIADIVEDLTHDMCYLFGRATKAVSLCPPAYYADLAYAAETGTKWSSMERSRDEEDGEDDITEVGLESVESLGGDWDKRTVEGEIFEPIVTLFVS
ncbi:Piwi, PAZ and DUF1785 domain protein [Purpureocillium lavendulum]|uniref:Piwi, PAZ and DUF1785 domain protein n=1 Tax=Purpureocillium lavendulum TaxID=1247861 RepID=A0AB34FI05_9HYPO|nr:Piwi, PAZ and DUF1785 domain protein [Purpureocillium lavendulum]